MAREDQRAMIKNHRNSSTRSANIAAKVIAAVLCCAFAAVPAFAQNELPGEVIDLPSVSEYRLPPAEQRPGTPAAEGPVDEGTPPPQTATPAAPRPTVPAPSRSRTPQVVAPTARVPAERPPSTATRSPQLNPATSAPPPQRPVAGEPVFGPQSAPPASDTAQPIITPDDNIVAIPTNDALPSNMPEPENTVVPEPVSGNINMLLAAAAALLALLAVLALLFWRKKKSNNVQIAESALEDLPARNPALAKPAARKPAPKIFSPPDPAKQKGSAPANTGGFITSKIGAIPPAQPNPVPMPKQPAPNGALKALAPDTDQALKIELKANGASSTLLNAVLNYSVTLTNTKDTPLKNIALSGAMMQADARLVQGAETPEPGLLHEVENLAAGEAITLSGEIRLPLYAIEPIAFNSQKLFVPLTRFVATYNGSEDDLVDKISSQSAAFIIGKEHEPPRPKMAPFRLDLGPQIFKPVGQRPVTI